MKITKNKFNTKNLLQEESLFHTANGYLGIRGSFEEGYPQNYPTVRGSYLNGVYENIPIEYAEKLYGFPTEGQRMISLPDFQTTRIIAEDETFSLFEGEIISYKRTLNLEKGLQLRAVSWQSPKGKILNIKFIRITSFEHKHLFFNRIILSSPNYSGKLQIESKVGGFVKRQTNKDDPRVAKETENGFAFMTNYFSQKLPIAIYTTRSSLIRVAIVQKNIINDETAVIGYQNTEDGYKTLIVVNLEKNKILTLDKFTTVSDSLRNKSDFETLAIEEMNKVIKLGGNKIISQQVSYLKTFWKGCKVELDQDKALEDRIAFAQFQLLQCAASDSYGFVAAKGLSGEGYEGHYFWDTEIYVFPFFLFTRPTIAKSLLKFRYNMLGKAKVHARDLGHKRGALYPWRTINGGECSSYFPSGSAQYHINNDIAYTFIEYYNYTKDLKFMENYGFEVLYETALLFLDTGHYDRQGRFCIDCVTGPDEYTCIVNNNYFTNLGAQYTMRGCLNIFKLLSSVPDFVDMQVIEELKKASVAMYLPYDEKLGIFKQDDSFLNKAKLDIKSIPKDKFPLLLYYHPLFLYRHQVCKQADTVLAHMLYGSDIDINKQKRSYDYYEKITTHDSTLSECVFCIQACNIGYMEKAFNYFLSSSETDLEDKHENTKDGLHIANLGGAYLALIVGFAGLQIGTNGFLNFNFHTYEKIKSYNFRIKKDGCLLLVAVNSNKASFILLEGKQLEIMVKNKSYTITDKISEVELKNENKSCNI